MRLSTEQIAHLTATATCSSRPVQPRGNALADLRRARAVRAPRGLQRARRAPMRCARISPPTSTASPSKLARHPRMVEPVQDLFGEKLYMHQFKINGKMAFEGRRLAVAPGLRHLEERRPDAHRTRHERGDLPGRRQRLQRAADVHPWAATRRAWSTRSTTTTTSYPLWTVDNDLIRQLVERAGGKNGGIVSPTGPAGSMISSTPAWCTPRRAT